VDLTRIGAHQGPDLATAVRLSNVAVAQRTLIHQLEMQSDPCGARDEGALHERRLAANMLVSIRS
jgi:hypothetical protein